MRFSLLASSRSSTACLAPNIKTQSPLRERKEQLRQPLSRTGSPLQFSDHHIGRGSGVLRRGLVSCRWRASSPSAWMRPTRPAIAAFRSTSNARTGQATIAVGISRRTSPDLSLSVIEIALRNGSALRCMGTCVVALAMVAEGSIDAYYEAHVQPWDCLAGIMIVHEARGRTNEVPGPLMLAHGGPLLASAGAIRPSGGGDAGSIGPHPSRRNLEIAGVLRNAEAAIIGGETATTHLCR